jgi:hypothetical protein
VTDERLHILGIRHHGPGSAASVLDALGTIDPAVVLIEGPADANDVLSFASSVGMVPPVALLVHATDDPARAAFYPYAEYSPEWQAMLWALAHKRVLQFIDLPAGARLDRGDEDESELDSVPVSVDPLGMLAEAAGQSDGESWWNALVEQGTHGGSVFPAIAAAMTTLREAAEADGAARDKWEAIREAHMRRSIRDALKEHGGAVAVICGAWHVPALAAEVSRKDDSELLKGLKKTKTVATWVPWTDTRLAVWSGYGAGVVSPGWYRHLWRTREQGRSNPHRLAAGWQAEVAGLLRAEGLPAATASAIEATRLALGLASLRGYPTPGLAEMRDASLAALCQGNERLLGLIETRLVIGTAIGTVDDSVPRMPLLADLESWLKKTRLKLSGESEEILLDLRSEAGLLKSTLFHRLALIGVTWAALRPDGGGRGTFRERWTLNWQPELNVKLAEALRWGATIEQAAGGAARELARETPGVASLARLVEACLRADLPETAEALTAELQNAAVHSTDIEALMHATAPLANVLRYGTARQIPVEALTRLVGGMATEVIVGLQHGCRDLDAEATAKMLVAMRAFDGAVALLEDRQHLEGWRMALGKLVDDMRVAAFLRGYAVRRLYDSSVVIVEDVARHLSLALSPAVPAATAADWLEGFLSESSQLLLHDSVLLGLIDDWLLELEEAAFVELLPALRRAMGGLDLMERRRLFEQLNRTPSAAAVTDSSSADVRADAAFAAALPLLKLILGLDEDERQPDR